ncbi:MAG: DUF971 domain-containing protein [Blastocatellia bacterium]|nr:DUF971 domain-containing protein [Blastocatellia bacterium]MCS7157783.1 DUF971 domain-containing protein [Blastocatellia bacterium]MCX7753296.1 DUF971 domain-containing protein [Blastocatellia bacterium]MDW8168142.1 DUF971 domain-containing protein [Acidobacteriota bacterium]MDW8257611.1 DUF971 domain-containing protein [Acidobacteriota bacterium]
MSAHGPIRPSAIKKVGASEIHILWSDGHASIYRASYLRRHCRCALCVDELTGRPTLVPETIPDDLTIISVELVGQYALHFQWSDGHSTGIYPFAQLRALCPCELCASASSRAAPLT